MTGDRSLTSLERVIRHMTGKLRPSVGDRPADDMHAAWWVLVCGDPLDSRSSLDQRDQARDRLRRQVSAAGIPVGVYEWVWDTTNQVQLVIGRHQKEDSARKQARSLLHKGFRVRVVPSMKEA